MLQTMRSSAKFVFWILAIAFIGGFLLVETSGLLGRTAVTPTTAVASVNGTDILYTDWQRRSQQLVQQEQQAQAGRSLTQDEITRIDNQAFDDMDVVRARFSVVGHGEHDPVATNATPAGMRLNRRVEVTLLGQRADRF